MISAKVNWNGARVLSQVKATAWENLARAVVYYWQQVEDALNVSANPIRTKRIRGKGSYLKYTNPGKPPGPPHKRTGGLQRWTIYALDKTAGEGRVGTTANARYGLYLELGKLSYLMLTLKKVWDRLTAIAGGR